ncbi:MAG: cation-transporting P-type ATPase [Parachlamydiales bacterium]|jgi:Ca2+-transporting ATPase
MFCKNPHTFSFSEVLHKLETERRGLSSEEANKRLRLFGRNVLKEEGISYFQLFFQQFNNLLIYILCLAALISLFSGRVFDFWVIFLILVLNGVLGFWQEVKAAVSIMALKKLIESQDKVFRDHKAQLVPSSELVPGDVVLLFEGSIVSADMRLIASSSLMADEAPLTGESMPVDKEAQLVLKEGVPIFEQKNMLFAGTTIVRGVARAVVVNTAKNTYLATLAAKAQKEPSPETPLTRAFKLFTKRYAYFLIGLILALGLIAFWQHSRDLKEVAYILIAQLVSAVPEGLPLVVTLVLVIGAIRLAKKNTLVRHLPSVETLGSATVIASDKTGTITTGNIKVEKVFTLDEEKLKLVAMLCNDAEAGKGDAVDVALAVWIKDFEKERLKYARIWSHGFDARLYLMAAAYEIQGKKKLLIKGALEKLKKFAVNKKDLALFDEKEKLFSNQGLRTIAFGFGDFVSSKTGEWEIEIIGLIGFLDPPKESAFEAVRAAQEAGIRVVMMTGDFSLTAKTIASKVGIYHPDDLILTGEEMEQMEIGELSEVLKKASVFARILPEHKHKLVKMLQAGGEIVVVSGDGINDVPALKAADLGIAMGSGTEAAKSVSKMIITDNDLRIIVEAIRGGRTIISNLRKVCYYLLSTALLELFLISFAILANLPLPLLPIQILWINLITSGVIDKVFPFAKEEEAVMRKKPSNSFFDWPQVARIVFFGGVVGWAGFELFRYLLETYSYEVTASTIFTASAAAQWANGVQAQKEREPFFKNLKKSFTINPYLYLALAVGVALQLLAIYAMPKIFHVIPLPWALWKYPLMLAFLGFFVVELRKWLEIFFSWLKKKIARSGFALKKELSDFDL